MFDKIEDLDPKKHIIIKGARMHNLQNIDVAISRNKLVVITGLSGSGKSSLAFDTLYAEGQRRYIESLSSYARQFLGKIEKPDVDYIKGISPAIAIEQKVISRNSRSTVGTSTEIYDYLKLLFARIGITYSPVSGKEVKRHSIKDVLEKIASYKSHERALLIALVQPKKGENTQGLLDRLSRIGFARIEYKGDVFKIEDVSATIQKELSEVRLVIDRFVTDLSDEDNKNRIAQSIESSFVEGNGKCLLLVLGDQPEETYFSNIFELDGITFEIPSDHFFSFNNPVGACKKCEGFGHVIGIDEDLVIPNKALSIYEDALLCWKGEKMMPWKERLIMNADKFNFPIHKPYYELSNEQREILWTGNQYFKGLNAFFTYIESKSYKIQYRVMLSRYRGRTICPDCKGTRLRKDANYVKVEGKSITDIVLMPVKESIIFFKELKLDAYRKEISKRLLTEIINRLQFLMDVGLGYLTLNRLSSSLSGGESQRINLATSLGSSLVGSTYILDEPSIGLHPRDTDRLIDVLCSLRDEGNTVVVVEHDEEIMKKADELIDMGPEAGTLGGKVVFQGTHQELVKKGKSLTADYLLGRKTIAIPEKRRVWKKAIRLTGVRQNNLKNIDVTIPLRVFTAVTGVSGSGKTSLIKGVFYPALKKMFSGIDQPTGAFDRLEGNIEILEDIEFVDQNPIGKSSRSNPATYVKAYDDIRTLFADQQSAKIKGYKPAHFSFNLEGGRCESCEGEGEVTIEMQFMSDIKLLCETCKGKRFKEEILEVMYKEKNIADLLEMTIDDAIDFFRKQNDKSVTKIINKLQPLQDVGLGYVTLGQSSSTLSGGEAQRIKLATYLGKGKTEKSMLFIFDEPTTGLHFHDIQKLLKSFNALIDNGHSIVVVEHNMDVVKTADWVIDLGPEGGNEGGALLFQGTPEELIDVKQSFTATYLKEKLQ